MATDRAAYMRAYRRTVEGRAQLDAQKKRAAAKNRAVAELIERHQDEFDDLWIIELRNL
jgi:hypothetical protein